MVYIKVSFVIANQEQSDMLVAVLADSGYDGFEESEAALLAYIERPKFHEDELKSFSEAFGVSYNIDEVPVQNWNALWESNFPPVVVSGFCTIRAHFHDIQVTTPYDIQITPKMSFGTGHHATTQLMMRLMEDVDMKGKSVLDFGAGTGVLAILAELLGATCILAIDNDMWCVENATENIARNNCRNIEVRQGSLEDAGGDKYAVILANINRHILLEYMPLLYEKLDSGGTLLMSGLLAADKDIIVDAAVNTGFIFERISEQMNWIALVFKKA